MTGQKTAAAMEEKRMEKIFVASGSSDHTSSLSLTTNKVNQYLADGWKLKEIRTEKNRNLIVVIYILEK